MADVGRRRWWPLAGALARLDCAGCSITAAGEMDSRVRRVAAGRDACRTPWRARVSRAGDPRGRAWDPGLENLWVHCRLRRRHRLGRRRRPHPPGAAERSRRGDNVVRLPSEAALTTWIAHRCHRALQPLFSTGSTTSAGARWRVRDVGHRRIGCGRRRHAGSAVGRLIELGGMRRGQAVLDALVSFGLPVRRGCAGNGLLN